MSEKPKTKAEKSPAADALDRFACGEITPEERLRGTRALREHNEQLQAEVDILRGKVRILRAAIAALTAVGSDEYKGDKG